jgi:hypothetical protein
MGCELAAHNWHSGPTPCRPEIVAHAAGRLHESEAVERTEQTDRNAQPMRPAVRSDVAHLYCHRVRRRKRADARGTAAGGLRSLPPQLAGLVEGPAMALSAILASLTQIIIDIG